MSHNHNHNHDSLKSGMNLAFWLNFIFSIIELIGGLLTNSTAIIADAFHDFMDALAIAVAIFLDKVAKKERTDNFSYGFKRFSLLSALLFSVFLLAGSVVMLFSAYKSFFSEREVHSLGMILISILGLAVNGFAFAKIKIEDDAHHKHSHGGKDYNKRSVMLHLLEDVLGWAAVLFGAIIIYFTHWYWIDGILTVGIAIFIGTNASKNLYNTIKLMLQSVPENVNIDKLIDELKEIANVIDIHDVHVWSMDGTYNIGSLHAVISDVDKSTELSILNEINLKMKENNIQHPTIQIEHSKSNCELEEC